MRALSILTLLWGVVGAQAQMTLGDIAGRWKGDCIQRGILQGTVQDDLELIELPPENSSAKCAPQGLWVHYDFTVDIEEEGGSYTFSRSNTTGMYRSIWYHYGPEVVNSTGVISSSVEYSGGKLCVNVANMSGEDHEIVSFLASLKKDDDGNEVYVEEGVMESGTNKRANKCYGQRGPKLFVFPLLCSASTTFTYRCTGYRVDDFIDDPPPLEPPPSPEMGDDGPRIIIFG